MFFPLAQNVAVSGITGLIDPETQVHEFVGVVQQKRLARLSGGKSEVWPSSSNVEAQKKQETGTGHSAPSQPCRIFRAHGRLVISQQASEGASLAPRTEATFNALRDPEKRLTFARHVFPREVQSLRSNSTWTSSCSPANLRSAVEHLQPLLGHPRDLKSFIRATEQLSRARIPHSIREAIRLGWLKAL